LQKILWLETQQAKSKFRLLRYYGAMVYSK